SMRVRPTFRSAPANPGSGQLQLSGGVVVGETQERVETEGAVVAGQLGARGQVVAGGGVLTEIQARRIVAVVEKARVVGAHHPSLLPGDGPVSVFQDEIPQDFVLGQIIDDVIEAGAKRPNDLRMAIPYPPGVSPSSRDISDANPMR